MKMSRWKFPGRAGALILCTAGLALALTPHRAPPEPPLAAWALHPHDLPEGSAWKDSGLTTADDPSQPLNRHTSGWSAAVLAYREAYKVGAVLWDGQHSAYVGNYLYRYADPAQAEAAAEEIVGHLRRAGQDRLLSPGSPVESRNLRGQTMGFSGSEGDALYGFIGVRGRTLILLMVNGMPAPSTEKAFESLIPHLLKR